MIYLERIFIGLYVSGLLLGCLWVMARTLDLVGNFIFRSWAWVWGLVDDALAWMVLEHCWGVEILKTVVLLSGCYWVMLQAKSFYFWLVG